MNIWKISYERKTAVNRDVDISPYLNTGDYHKVSNQFFTYFEDKGGLLNRILQNSQMVVVVWALDGKIIWFNKHAWQITGFSKNGLDGTASINSIIPQDVAFHIKKKLRSIEDKNLQYRFGGQLVSKDGREVCIEWDNYIISDDEGREHIVSVGIDITNLKNAEERLEKANSDLAAANEELTAQQEELSAMNEELMAQEEELKYNLYELKKQKEALQRSEERYRLVVEGASDGLWDWDLVNDTVYISKEWSIMLGLGEEEICGYYEKWKKLIHPKDAKKYRRQIFEENCR
ncbi:PAS domain S-box protein [Ruminiclostridium papyrosolvens DSM 2782]|uniref:PAS domain S-box protein n=1 Tax=Ruminiclostridium papyrosolvens TaxID=29362 RepID=UPI0023E37931|nr:PAS domain S-box protein [Ruminiclostridium papyrosolvens]WES33297.1 PAS domain S-box protein [Ruminiclostridium papyrosolvens DSM 2782]